MALTKFGEKTKSVFLNEAESRKLHLAFEVAEGEEIKKGQPVVLTAEGHVKPANSDGSDYKAIIGYSVQNAEAGDECTIAVRGYATLFAMSGAAVQAGPVRYSGMNTTDGMYTNWENVAAGDDDDYAGMHGWALDEAEGEDEPIRVVII